MAPPEGRGRVRTGREVAGILASVALVLVAYHQVAFGGRTFDTSTAVNGANGLLAPTGAAWPGFSDPIRVDKGASAWQTVPWAEVVHRQLAGGKLPLWNPYEGAGEPLVGNMQAAAFDPLLLAVNLHPTPLTWDLSFLFAFMLAAAAMYLFLRNLGLSTPAAVAGSGAFTLCGYFAMNNNLSFARLYLYLPVLFLLIDKVATSPKLRWVGALGAAIAGSILGGMPEVSFFVLAAAGGYGAYRLLGAGSGARLRAAVRMTGGGALGLLLASPLLVLFFGFLSATFNSHGTDRGSSYVQTPTLLNWLVPYVNGYPTAIRVAALLPDRSWSGAAAAALGLVATAAPRAMRRHAGWFFLALGGVLLLKVHGVAGLGWIGKLPVADRSDFVAYSPAVASFCFAVLAAIGVDALRRGELRLGWLAAGACGAAAVLLLLIYWNREVLALTPHTPGWGRYANFALATAAGGAVLAAAAASAWSKRMRVAAAVVAVVVLLAELTVLFSAVQFAPRTDPYDPAPAWLPLVTRASDPASRVFGLDGKLYSDTAGVFGLQDVRSLNALFVKRYMTYIQDFVSPSFTDRFTGDAMSPAEIEDNPMFDLLGVRWVLTGATSLDPAGGQYRLAGTAAGTQIYENQRSIARAFMVTDTHQSAGIGDTVAYLQGLGHPFGKETTRVDRFDPSRQAVVEVPGGGRLGLPTAGAEGAGPASAPRPATIVGYEPDRVVVDVPAGPPGLLVLTDAFVPGWEATVNGKAATVLPTDVAFRGVVVGGGASRVVFRYRPPGVGVLWAPPVVGVLGLAAAGVLRRLRGRRSRPRAAPARPT